MRSPAASLGSVEILTRALRAEFPELDPERLRAAVERAVARAATAALDTEGYRVVDMHLARAEATEEGSERAQILRDLSDNLEERGDADRALVTRLAAFSEVATAADLPPLLRLARITERWSELPLESMNALVDIHDDAGPRLLTELANAWQHVGRGYYAADCLERVLLFEPTNAHANEALEVFYRSTAEWPVLIDLLGRRAVHAATDKERAELMREIALIYDRELADEGGAYDAYREADRLAPGHPDVIAGLAKFGAKLGVSEEEALASYERLAGVVTDPKERARVLCRAAELAKLQDWDKAQALYERARKDDPELVAAIDGLVQLARDRGQLADAISLLTKAADRPALATERSRWLTDAADFCVAIGDTDWAKQLYRDARAADPENQKAGAALVELCWDTGSLAELAPILEELCRITEDPAQMRGYLMKRSKVAAAVGDQTGARNALSRAVDLDPDDWAARRELGDLLFEAQKWEKARPVLEALLRDEDLLPPDVRPELHYRIARCARELGDNEGARKHAGITLALLPDHRAALLLRTELDGVDPQDLVADQLALAAMAPPDEKATRFAALGDRYSELDDRAAAREMYREALVHRPGDHLLLTKFLGLVTEDGDWSYSLDVVQRLIDTEQDPKVRARYRHLGAMIARDELGDRDQAAMLLDYALEDDPAAVAVADDLEALLAASGNREPLIKFYYRRLEHERVAESRPGEQLRLWDRVGEQLLQLGHTGDALVAFEVGVTLAPDDLTRRTRLADLYLGADPAHAPAAIAHHHVVLRGHKKRIESYRALRMLYDRTSQPRKVAAIDEALVILGTQVVTEQIDALFDPSQPVVAPGPRDLPTRPLGADDWLALGRVDVDVQLSALFALVAPPFAVERARLRPPLAVPAKEHELPASVARVLAQVATTFGVARPASYLDREQPTTCKVAMRAREGVLVPVLLLGRPVADRRIDDHELAFQLARQLADLRSDRIARLLCPRAGELAQIIELATAPPGDPSRQAARWLAASLHPVELDQALAIGGRLRERGVHPMSAAIEWLAATERAADRIGFVVAGDLARCAKLVESERVVDLAWSSITEEILGVRARLEGWPAG